MGEHHGNAIAISSTFTTSTIVSDWLSVALISFCACTLHNLQNGALFVEPWLWVERIPQLKKNPPVILTLSALVGRDG